MWTRTLTLEDSEADRINPWRTTFKATLQRVQLNPTLPTEYQMLLMVTLGCTTQLLLVVQSEVTAVHQVRIYLLKLDIIDKQYGKMINYDNLIDHKGSTS